MRQETKQLFPLEFFAPNFHTHPHTSNEASVVLSYLNTQYDSPLYKAANSSRFFFQMFDPRSQSRMRCYGWCYFSLSTLTYGLQFLIWWHHSSFPFLDGKHEELFAELHTDQEATSFICSNTDKTKIKKVIQVCFCCHRNWFIWWNYAQVMVFTILKALLD